MLRLQATATKSFFNTKNAFQQVKFGLKLEVNAGSKTTTTTTTTTLSTSCNF
jgi:hypothetical protein